MKTIRQTIFLRGVEPHDVYETLLDARKHAKLTGAPATISRRIGGAWSAYGGSLSGKTTALVPDQKIVQSWRGDDWPEGHYSTATFSFAKVRGGTRLTFRQTGVPDDLYAAYRQGWIDSYWAPLKRQLTAAS